MMHDLPKTYAWVEGNSRSKETVDHIVDGFSYYEPHVDAMIVTTMPNVKTVIEVYPEYVSQSVKPIVGGIKLINFPGVADDKPWNFTDLESWRLVALLVHSIVKDTNQRVVLFDCETALKPWYTGQVAADALSFPMPLLCRALDVLPYGVIYLWSGLSVFTPAPYSPDRVEQNQKLIKTINQSTNGNSYFVDGSLGYTDEYDRRNTGYEWGGPHIKRWPGLAMMQYPHVQNIFVRPDGWIRDSKTGEKKRECFAPKEALQEIEMRKRMFGDVPIGLYPGYANWVEVGEMLNTD